MADLTGLHHVALTVTDLDRSATWYRDVLGFEDVFTEDEEARRAVILRLPTSGASLGLVEHRPSEAGGFDPRTTGLDHLAFTAPTRADLDAWVARLAELGVDHDGPHDIPPGAIVNLKDPDGIALSLFWDR